MDSIETIMKDIMDMRKNITNMIMDIIMNIKDIMIMDIILHMGEWKPVLN
jgi:hypothetical protein